MIGLIAFAALVVLTAIATWAFIWTSRAIARRGGSKALARAWATIVVTALSLPITWDALPTWIAFEYYSSKEAGMTVFKTLTQWKAENPGVAETLEPYGATYVDKREKTIRLSDWKSRRPINDRFAVDQETRRHFLTVQVVHQDLVDTNAGEVLARWTVVGAGQGGGLHSGGEGWWKFWLKLSSSTEQQRNIFDKIVNEYRFARSQK